VGDDNGWKSEKCALLPGFYAITVGLRNDIDVCFGEESIARCFSAGM